LQLKRAVQTAGKRYRPSSEFRAHMRNQIAAPRRSAPAWLPVSALLAVLLVVGTVTLSVRQRQLAQQRTFVELADLHVATLASTNPVDVISTDRHTVKPWFQGKIPFTFNLPELQNSEFTLLGGRVAYLEQAPGAELIYQVRKHQISVFIFPNRFAGHGLAADTGVQVQAAFHVESWSHDSLRYFVIGDASADDIRNLTALLQKAAQM